MIFLEVNSFIWMVTGLGFCLVLLLLFVFVYVLKLMGWIMQPRVKPKKQIGRAHV